MVLLRPLSRSISLASRAALFSTCSSATRPSVSRAAGLSSKLSSTTSSPVSKPQFQPSSIRALTTAREKVKVLLVLYDGGKHAEDVSAQFSRILLLFVRLCSIECPSIRWARCHVWVLFEVQEDAMRGQLLSSHPSCPSIPTSPNRITADVLSATETRGAIGIRNAGKVTQPIP